MSARWQTTACLAASWFIWVVLGTGQFGALCTGFVGGIAFCAWVDYLVGDDE